MKIDNQLIGIAGVHFVAGELSKRGYIALVTSRNTRGIDILASGQKGGKQISIQVKTTTKKKPDWMLDKKAEKIFQDDLFYIFVQLKNKEMPGFHIVSSKEVVKQVSKYHKKWLKTPNRKGGKHNDNPRRRFVDNSKKYLDKWDLLGIKMAS